MGLLLHWIENIKKAKAHTPWLKRTQAPKTSLHPLDTNLVSMMMRLIIHATDNQHNFSSALTL
jgi:hypothetical protein